MACYFITQRRLGGLGLGAQSGKRGFGLDARSIDFVVVLDQTLGHGFVFFLLARKLLAQLVAFPLHTRQPGLQRATVSLKLTCKLHYLPNAGSEDIKILQHGRYRKPSACPLGSGSKSKVEQETKVLLKHDHHRHDSGRWSIQLYLVA